MGTRFKQTYATKDKGLRRKAMGDAPAKQFRRLQRALRRQRTIMGIVIREIERKLAQLRLKQSVLLEKSTTLRHRARSLQQRKPKDKNKLYALHAPEVECIGKGKARQFCEFGVKAGFAITDKKGLM